MKTLQRKNALLILGVLIAVLAALTFAGYNTAAAARAEQLPIYTYEADGRTFESADSAEDAWQQATGRKQMINL